MLEKIKNFFKDLFHVKNMVNADRYEWIEVRNDDPVSTVNLTECYKNMVKRELNARVHNDEFIDNVMKTLDETKVNFVTTEMCGIRWIKYYESERHVFWTPVDDVLPVITYSPRAMKQFVAWMGERLHWDMMYVQMVLPSHHQAKRITSFFRRNAIPYRNFWQTPSFIGRLAIGFENWISTTFKFGKSNSEEPTTGAIRPIIIETKTGDEDNE